MKLVKVANRVGLLVIWIFLIPKGVLLQILGPSKVYKQVIKKLINSTIADYVEKENLKVTNDLRVEQSFEELEETFEPGADFSFDAVLILQQVV
ncbi:hypothetical protein GIB67_028483 [Kingdonia uniflora]|uniref:Trigger factor ribosome-binding bacterial domain-containing protein n=1 Tax=Kingdonia uniflora TaxID=39325 RepID=A0A7J7P182_9MAGN|nr:hypothetical protein GIB67_028483 [Kingdonia uniflora]